MVKPRKHLEIFLRDGQPYKTRLNRIRLGFNEYVPHIGEELFRKIINDLNVESFSSYPEINLAYDIMAQYLNISVGNIVLGHGSDSALFMALSAFCDPGDVICSVIPTYGMYEVYADMLACKFIKETYDSDRQVSLSILLDLLKHKPKVVILANPNGVIGTRINDEVLERFIVEADKNDTLVIIDEAYAEFSTKTLIDKINVYKNLVIVRSFSKSMGMAGLRIGYLVLDKSLRESAYKMKPVVELNSVAISAIKVLCENKQIVKDLTAIINSSKAYFIDELRKLNFNALETETNFVLVNFQERETIVINELSKRNIEFKKLTESFEGYYRITVGSKEIMKHVINVLKEIS